MNIWSWLGVKIGARQKVQPGGSRAFESLEPRLLLSADLAGAQPVLSHDVVPADPAIYVDLDHQDTKKPEELSPILTLDVLPTATQGSPAATQGQRAVELFSVSPALFVENQGQWSDPSVRYVHDGKGVDVVITDAKVLFQSMDTDAHVLRFSASFAGSNQVRPVGREPSESRFNYYMGDQANWRGNVPSYEVVAYEGLYEGIDLRVQGLRSHLKYEFHVAPGADYSRIAIRYEGIEGLSLGEDGSLEVNLGTGRGMIRDDAPYIYQEIDGRKVEVAGRFILLDDRTYSFEVTGDIDPDHVLVIDPDLAWSTYLGGSDSDWGSGIAVDTSGSVYVTGKTSSPGWTSGGFDTTHNNAYDAFVAKLSSDGAHLWSTYLGGDVNDAGSGIAVDSSGNVYVTGYTYVTGHTDSPGWTSGGFDTTYNGGGTDAFVAKLSSSGAHLWSTFLGGNAFDWGYGIAVDSLGNAYVTGYTNSGGWTSGGFDTTRDGMDAFVAKLSSGGAHLWSTYLGGADSMMEGGNGIAVDASNNVYVTGYTESSGWTSGGFDTTYNGGSSDAFVAKLSSSGAYRWSTYLGGSDNDVGYGIAVDSSGNVYVTGNTTSSGWTSGGFDTTYNGGYDGDAFVAKLSSSGAHLWSTYLGGSVGDAGYGIAVGSSGSVYVTGNTASSGWTSGGFDTTYNGGSNDAFVAKLSSSGAHLWSTYLGGSDTDWGYGIAVDSSRNAYVTGYTYSSGWTSGGFDTTYNGGSSDAFVMSIGADPDTTPPTIGGFAVSPTSVTLGDRFTISYTVSDSGESGLIGVDLWRTNDLASWPAQAVARNSATGDGPVSGSFSDAPPSVGDWWYGIQGVDTAGNSTRETQPIHVVVNPPDTTPPSPNPSTWATEPYATGPTSIRMVATAASDPSGVQYYFYGATAGGHDSGWQDDATYEDTGLSPATSYLYQVKTRDGSANQNETGYSTGYSATTEADTTAPTIRGFSVSPVSVILGGGFAISYTVSDTGGSGLDCVELWRANDLNSWTGPAVGQNAASGDGPVSGSFSDIPPATGDWWYGIHVFDTAGNSITESQPIHVVVNPPDTTPPSPNPSTWATVPYSTGATSIRMIATTATDPSGVQYYFHSVTSGGHDSGWRDSNSYEDKGLLPGTSYAYQVKTRDNSLNHNEGTYSTSASATTRSPVYRFWSPVLSRHFYTISEREKNKLISNYSNVWIYEQVAYYAFAGDTQANLAPVYRFWSGTLNAHFYTMSESEKTKLINNYSNVWTYEKIAFYAYAAGSQPAGTGAVYRFWSGTLGSHFFTMDSNEKDRLINLYSHVWTYESIAWYAYGA
jgi:hypothetical protein